MYACLSVDVSVCMLACIREDMHACTLVCIYVYVGLSVSTCACRLVCVYVCVYVCMYACPYLYVYVRLSVYVFGRGEVGGPRGRGTVVPVRMCMQVHR